ncbi:c-type cytochrome [Mucilaginibacter lappiensis]|uniref:Cytochrome c551/c552 n=1 Tax=Mucilaginibacter lappiensis TaxID=354630 RepID=A0A841J8B7_9SPHI|nr:c-type cytochrome [Mucilaginibacter lappiensis]MBB6127333.1 cytochrome c551/c552 [Mucilaginibacter lappiensis]
MDNTLKQMIKRSAFLCTLVIIALLSDIKNTFAQAESPKEDDFFKIMKVPAPEGTILEVGGLCTLPNGTLAVTTRRGDIFMVENPTGQHPFFRKFASGLHEVLGAAWKDGALYVVQRGELTKLVDTNMDGKADVFETIYAWPLSGNYHEYSFGPKIAPDGSFFVTLNLGFPPDWWHPKSFVPWRGWALNIKEDGTVTPWAAGFRSPCGISMIDGELWYADNQGDWVGSGSIMPIKKGAFMGHPSSLVWTGLPNSPLKLTPEQFFAKNNPRIEFDKNGQPVKPQDIVNEKFKTEFEAKKEFPELQLPAVWLPHGILGISNSEIVKIPEGAFGPFSGQLLICDQGQSMIDRIFLEKVNGEYQGAAWAFRSGFQSGIVRLAWLPDGSLATGETNRGWGSAGEATMGLQRLVWNNRVPFEMRAIRAMPDGFEIEFTKPVDKKVAADIASYSIESFIYKYHGVYGSPPVNTEKCPIAGVKVSEDGLKARLIVNNLRRYYIHTITLAAIRDKESYFNLVHPTAYYTLNNIPEGQKLSMSEVSTLNSAKAAVSASVKKAGSVKKGAAVKPGTLANAAPTYADVQPLLLKNTCLSCHNATKRQVGPAYMDVAKRKYSVAELIQLIHNPKPEHWPDYSTPMPPMPQVPKEDARKIALWIKSLAK